MKKIISLLVIGTMMTVGVSMSYAADPKVLPAKENTPQKNQPEPEKFYSKYDPATQNAALAGVAVAVVGLGFWALSGDDNTTTPSHHTSAVHH
jgi:hypothetical protein